MATEKILRRREIGSLIAEIGKDNPFELSRAIEQAVLQSPEIQALRKDAEAFRLMVSHRLTVKVDAMCADVEVFRLGECLSWPPAHHCENDTELTAVARDAIHSAIAAMEQQK